MSKQMTAGGCALVMLLGLVASGQLSAQVQTPFIASTRHAANDAERQINAALDAKIKTPLQYDGEQLDIVLETISHEYNIPIVFDKAALDEVAIAPESEVTINLQNISLRSALDIMFRESGLEDLTYMIDSEVLLITTDEGCYGLSVEVYRVDDLLEGIVQFNATNHSDAAKKLIDVITSCVAHDSWLKNETGEGEIHFIAPGMLVVSQTPYVHEEIEDLLYKLRTTKASIVGSSKTTSAVAKPVTKGFAININLGKKPGVEQRLAQAITQSVDWGANEDHGQWIEVLPDRVLVHHKPQVVDQVRIVLTDMEVLDREYHAESALNGGGQSAGGGFF